MVMEMDSSVTYWLLQEYQSTGLGEDALPSAQLQAELRKLTARWRRAFAKFADWTASRFVDKVQLYSDRTLESNIRAAVPGFEVKFNNIPRPMRDVLQASVHQNVSLIKSISSQYLDEVEGLVMRSVTRGRDSGALARELRKRYGITQRRADFIARDQNNKATSAIQAARQKSTGIVEGIWKHSHAGKTPRPSHLKADGQRFDISKGLYLDGKWTMPGEEPNCRCTWQPIIPGFD